jgi:hypothetical protein
MEKRAPAKDAVHNRRIEVYFVRTGRTAAL